MRWRFFFLGLLVVYQVGGEHGDHARAELLRVLIRRQGVRLGLEGGIALALGAADHELVVERAQGCPRGLAPEERVVWAVGDEGVRRVAERNPVERGAQRTAAEKTFWFPWPALAAEPLPSWRRGRTAASSAAPTVEAIVEQTIL